MTTQATAPYAVLILRIALGTMFIAHALLKILVFTPEGTVGYFASLGVPGWFAYPTMAIELIGGAMLILGIKTRPVSLALIPVLVGAMVLVHGAKGWLFTNEGGGWEYPLFLIAALIAQSLLGNGAITLKSIINKSH
ncbi:LysR family transcriptional regulator [Colwellia sp. 39_35_sub15_T18]|nr:LysR family transcriptional regulator [Colwellia sp. 39_35_sub15_T18]